jgi:uncharacterized phage protein gp47/JayE
MLLKKSSLQMEAEAIQELVQGGVLTNMTAGSRVRSILSVISKQNGRIMDALDVNTAMSFATSAVGYYLDLIGQLVGVDRGEATASFVLQEDQTIRFYVTTGVLKDYLPGGLIPTGTVIQTSSGGIGYTVTVDSPFPDDATEIFVSAIATSDGADQRVGRGQLTSHDLGVGGVLVTNDKPISNGQDQETDSNYRFRILNQWAEQATSNLAAIRLAALSTPGVADVILRRHFQGPGTVDVLITPTGNRVSDAMIGGAEARIERISAGGDFVTVRGPRYVDIALSTRIDFTQDTPDSEKQDIRNDVRDTIIDYLDDIPLGGQLIISELRARIQETSPRILDHAILCFSINGRPQILRNWRLFDDELFIPDAGVTTPIEVI